MRKNKLETFNVSFDLKLFTSIEIKAETFEEALSIAKDIPITDIISFEGEYLDGEKEISGVYK